MFQSILICSLAGVFYCNGYLLRICPNDMLNQLMSGLEISPALLGALAVFYSYAYTFAQLPAGLLLDRYGPRRMLTLASLCCTIGAFMFATSYNLLIAGSGRFLVGLGSAFALIGVLKLSGNWFVPKLFPIALGLIIAFGTLGAMFGNIVISWMLEKTSWQITLQLLAIIGVFLTPVLWIFIRDKPPAEFINNSLAEPINAQYKINTPYKLDSDSHSMKFSSFWQDTILLSKSSQLWINATIGGLLFLPTSVFIELWGHASLQNLHGLQDMTASTAISMSLLGWVIGAPIIGYCSEKMDRRKIFLQGAIIGTFLLFSIILYSRNLPISSLYFLLFLLGLISSPQILALVIAKDHCSPKLTATCLAFTNFIIMMGALIVQPLVGILLDLRLGDRIINSTFSSTEGIYSTEMIHSTGVYSTGHLAQNSLNNYSNENFIVALSILPLSLAVAFILTRFLKSK